MGTDMSWEMPQSLAFPQWWTIIPRSTASVQGSSPTLTHASADSTEETYDARQSLLRGTCFLQRSTGRTTPPPHPLTEGGLPALARAKVAMPRILLGER